MSEILNQTMNQTLNQTITTATNDVINTFLGHTIPVTGNPIYDIYILTLIISLFITLVNKYMSDQKKIKALRAELKILQKKMRKEMAKDPKKAQIMQKEIMKKNFENMKYAFNPKIMLITMVPLMFIFISVRQFYSPFGDILNVFGLTTFGWLGTYIIFSIINSMILKKVLDVA